MESSETPSNGIAKAVKKAVETHGHAFQYAVIEATAKAFDDGSQWAFEVAEFPVSVTGKDARIDFVLKHQRAEVYLSVECKRVNPRYSRWAFLRAPFNRRGSEDNQAILDIVKLPSPDWPYGIRVQGMRSFVLGEQCFHLPLVLRANDRSDEKDDSWKRKDIDDAAYQASLGASGLISLWQSAYDSGQTNAPAKRYVIPLVVTTADLWVSSLDLSTTDLATGLVGSQQLGLEEAEWLFYQYRVPESIKNQASVWGESITLSPTLSQRYVRTVPVVRSLAFPRFLSWLTTDVLFPMYEIPY